MSLEGATDEARAMAADGRDVDLSGWYLWDESDPDGPDWSDPRPIPGP